jgi:hypothetical protein
VLPRAVTAHSALEAIRDEWLPFLDYFPELAPQLAGSVPATPFAVPAAGAI